ncbi:hypothetical protein [Mycobacterium sp. HNNTM2301]|uniref:hypothetical protein n=1 Tax=Mycobacterium hainanense TaxID=3289775 RepID=UPI0035A6D574
MSGKLVGEVIHAAASLKAKGLSGTAFHALIAIAEKCSQVSGQGSVRWSHICDGIYGSGDQLPSKRTAERAVRELKDAGLLRVVRPGFNNNHGHVCAPVYEILLPTDTDIQLSRSVPTDTDVQVSASPPTDTDIQLSRSVPTDTDKHETDTDKIGTDTDTLGVVLDGSSDGTSDGNVTSVGAPAENSARATPADTKRGCRIPGDWRPSQATTQWARERFGHLDLNAEWEAFVNYWLGESGQRACKQDWDRAFRTWLHRARPKPALNRPSVNADGLTAGEAKVAGWASLGAPNPNPQTEIE